MSQRICAGRVLEVTIAVGLFLRRKTSTLVTQIPTEFDGLLPDSNQAAKRFLREALDESREISVMIEGKQVSLDDIRINDPYIKAIHSGSVVSFEVKVLNLMV